MANEKILKDALIELVQCGEIDVSGQLGGTKRVHRINPSDIIYPGRSPMLFPNLKRGGMSKGHTG